MATGDRRDTVVPSAKADFKALQATRMNNDRKIFVAGHARPRGFRPSFAGCAAGVRQHRHRVRASSSICATRAPFDAFFEDQRPEYVFPAAAKVGGIWANQTYPAEFLHDNLVLAVQPHSLRVSQWSPQADVFSDPSCVYPKFAPQPIAEVVAAHRARSSRVERVVRDCEDRGPQAVSGLPSPVRLRCHLGDAHQSLRAGRLLRQRTRTCCRRCSAGSTRRRSAGRRGGGVGNRHAAPRVPAWTISPPVWS